MRFEFFGMILIGGFLFIVGTVGLISGFYPAKLTLKNIIVLSFLLFSLDVQIRLLVRKQTTDITSDNTNKNSNAIRMVRDAYSIGLFPRNGSYVYWIYICQIGLILIWFSLFI